MEFNHSCFNREGEPFVYYYKIIDYLKTLSVKDAINVRFFTNGTLLSKDRLLELKSISEQTGVNYRFAISIDGITKETYENIRINGSFEKLIENINLIIQYFPIRFTFTLKKQNYKEAFQLKDFLEKTFKFKNYYEISFGADVYDKSLFKYLEFLKEYKSK